MACILLDMVERGQFGKLALRLVFFFFPFIEEKKFRWVHASMATFFCSFVHATPPLMGGGREEEKLSTPPTT